MNVTLKIGMFLEGLYACPVPPVPTGHWVPRDWVDWIDANGTWTTGWESVDTDTPDPDTITVSLAVVEKQVRRQFATAWLRINDDDPVTTAEGWGYWFAYTFLCDSLGITEAQQKELGR